MREFIATYFENAASIRDSWAAEHDDPDSASCAQSLQEAAAYVRQLPISDERFRRLDAMLANLGEEDPEVLASWLQDPDAAMVPLRNRYHIDPAAFVLRHGYRSPAGSPHDFLTEIVNLLERRMPEIVASWRSVAGLPQAADHLLS